uniref:Uncharacterized protein n=1 Tax=Globisporangium ultimum (strain ATCC 200006 / CBS 805.95 / DAOM BR144) TaxID=431595 RepID=K3X942_GLOUD
MGNSVTLHSACAYGDLGYVRKLLKSATPAELEAKDDSGKTPLLVAVASMTFKHDGEDEDDDLFFGDEMHDDDDESVTDGDLEDAANGNAPGADDGEGESKPSESDNVDSEPEAVEEFDENTSIEPLSKQAEILQLLIQKRVNLDHQDENGWTALHHACFVQNPVAIKMLIHAGAQPMREKYGLLPQDFLQRGQSSEWAAQIQELKETLDQITDKSPYLIKLLAFRPSGIVQLDMGGQVEKGSLVTIEYDVPENHSVKDYIQVLISEEDSWEIEIGSYHYVPAGKHGQITISTQNIASSSTIRFVYVKCDINTISRQVVASGCNAVVQASVGEIFQYELFLYERVVEVESIPEFEFIDQPLIVLKRIGVVVTEEEIDWVDIRPDNHIVAVNDIRIDSMEFSEAVRVLQENNGKKCTKLLMQNYSACGDFIPEKILGVGVVGKYAYLNPLEDEEHDIQDVAEHNLEEWVKSHSNSSGDAAAAVVDTLPQPPTAPFMQSDREVSISQESGLREEREHLAEVSVAAVDSKVDQDEDPANVVSEEKISASSTIETVVPLHNSFQLIEQLQQGISISRALG